MTSKCCRGSEYSYAQTTTCTECKRYRQNTRICASKLFLLGVQFFLTGSVLRLELATAKIASWSSSQRLVMTWDTNLLFTTSGCWQQRCLNQRECWSMSTLHRVHTEFAKIGRPSSHRSLCRPRVPFTPLFRAMSHSCL